MTFLQSLFNQNTLKLPSLIVSFSWLNKSYMLDYPDPDDVLILQTVQTSNSTNLVLQHQSSC